MLATVLLAITRTINKQSTFTFYNKIIKGLLKTLSNFILYSLSDFRLNTKHVVT